MKKSNLILASISLIFQVLGFIGIFISETNNQLSLSLVIFFSSCVLCGIVLIVDSKTS
jgi:hypothetical protein